MASKGDYTAVVEVDDDLVNNSPQLEFQDFNTLSQDNSISGNINSSNSQQYQQNFNPSFNPNAETGAEASKRSLFSIDYYTQYFDVDTDDVIKRIKEVFLIKTGGDRFLDNISIKPDLYGPFWISTSVAFSMFAVSSLMVSVGAFTSSVPFVYDFNQIWTSLFSVYIYTFLIPTLFYFVSNYFNARPILLDLITVYGYSMSVWILVAILCGINFGWLRWLLVIAGSGYSGYFLAVNLYPVFKRSESTGMRSGLLIMAIVVHIAFSIFMKIQYFSYEYSLSAPISDAKPADPTPKS